MYLFVPLEGLSMCCSFTISSQFICFLSPTGQQYPNNGPPQGPPQMKGQPVSYNQPPYGGGPPYNFQQQQQQQMRPNTNQYRPPPPAGMPPMQSPMQPPMRQPMQPMPPQQQQQPLQPMPPQQPQQPMQPMPPQQPMQPMQSMQPQQPMQPPQQALPPMAPRPQASMSNTANMIQKPPVSQNIPPLGVKAPKTVGEQCPTYRYTVDNNFVEFHTVPGNCKM